MAVGKRIVNDELCDIWALMMYEKLDQAMEKKENMVHDEGYWWYDGYIDGICRSVTMLSALENGKFVRDYERLIKTLKEDGNNGTL